MSKNKLAGIIVACIIVVIVVIVIVIPSLTPAPEPGNNLSINSAEGGSVTTPGEGLFVYDEGTVVNLVTEPEEGYRFVEWTGDVGTIAYVNDATTNITMGSNYFIIAEFEEIPTVQYDLNMTADPEVGGMAIDLTGELPYSEGVEVSIIAVANEDYEFVNWTAPAGGFDDANAPETTFAMPAQNVTVTANFVYWQESRTDEAPDFTLPTMTGANITLSELEGTPVVLNFWSISCSWCRKQLPYLENVAQQSGGEMKVIAVNIADNAASVQDFFGDYEPTMIVTLDETREVFQNYSSTYSSRPGSIPFTLFVDSAGIIQYKQTGAFQSETQLWDTLNSVFETTVP
jgi:peroxiredoxin